MADQEHRYEADNRVKWDMDRGGYFLTSLIAKHGKGPFRVSRVWDVPTSCNCGKRSHDPHHKQCGIHARKDVGHSQFVTIEVPDGRTKEFSGAWFVPCE